MKTREQGFSLIEVVITIGILMSLTIAVASMLRAGFDVKQGLSERAKVIHRLSVAMQRVADDIQMSFYVSQKDTVRNGIERNMKTEWKLEKNGISGDKLQLTTATHKPMIAGANESEFTFVVYELKDSKEQSGRKDLYRAETSAVPESLKDEQPERILARNIKTLNIETWTGEKWSQDRWATDSGDTRNRLPKMVRITIEAWKSELPQGESAGSEADEDTEKMSTVVYLANAMDYQELKDQDKSVKWGAL